MTLILYSQKHGYKRIILRTVSWWNCHWVNNKWFVLRNHFNLNFLIFGIKKCNGQTNLRFFNLDLEVGY